MPPTVIHNTFALPPQPPDVSRADPSRLRVYWFSQTIGPGRGCYRYWPVFVAVSIARPDSLPLPLMSVRM